MIEEARRKPLGGSTLRDRGTYGRENTDSRGDGGRDLSAHQRRLLLLMPAQRAMILAHLVLEMYNLRGE